MHWCMDETLAVLAMIPLIGYFFRKLHIWWHTKFHHKCHEEGCNSDHVEHTEEECHDHDSHKLTQGDILLICGWDAIYQKDAEERFDCLVDDLISDTWLLDVDEEPADDEFRWFVNDKGELRAVFRQQVFTHDDQCCEHGWRKLSQDELNAELKANQ